MSRPVVVVQARLRSTRFPYKILAPLHGRRTIVECVIGRARLSGFDVVVATTENDEGIIAKAVGDAARVVGVPGRGIDESDVLGRYHYVCETVAADPIIRVTSDCPLVDPFVIVEAVGLYRTKRCYTSNCHPQRTMPRGFEVEVFSFAALRTANMQATKPYDREHVTPFMYVGAADVASYEPQEAAPFDEALNLSIDTQDDYKLAVRVFAKATERYGTAFTWTEALSCL